MVYSRQVGFPASLDLRFMKGWQRLALVMAAAWAVGCDRAAPAPKSSAPSNAGYVSAAPSGTATSANKPPATRSTTKAATRPAPSIININNRSIVFPPARLRIENENDHLIAILYSDDPPAALRDNYTGNSFYLRMELNITDIADLPDASWHLKSSNSSTREDSPFGIFLTGRRLQLQPFDVQARFKQLHGKTIVYLAGQFLVLDGSTDRSTAPAVPVAAQFNVHLDPPPTTAQ